MEIIYVWQEVNFKLKHKFFSSIKQLEVKSNSELCKNIEVLKLKSLRINLIFSNICHKIKAIFLRMST